MANRNKAKGTSFETDVLMYFRDRGLVHAYRPALQGGKDTGDINGIRTSEGYDFIIQCKNQKAFDLSGWLNAAQQQAKNKSPFAIGAVVFKRPGVGRANMGKTYALLALEDLLTLLQRAGYR